MATYPQGQESHLFFTRAVRAQKGSHELGHSSDTRGNLIVSLELSGNDKHMIDDNISIAEINYLNFEFTLFFF